MENKEIIQKFNEFRQIGLKNTEDLLRAAKACLDAGVEHAAFHLSLLALEEIGKVEMEATRMMSTVHPKPNSEEYSPAIDDHEKKLFWALWGPSLGREKQTKDLLNKHTFLAKHLHEKRLLYLYSDPTNPEHWSKLMGKGEAKQMYEFAEVRWKMENSKGDLDPETTSEPDENLNWFLKAQEDDQKKREIWGHKSQEKLIELNDIREWIKWLREIYEKNEKAMRELMEQELKRQQPSEKEKMNPKWKVSVEIVTPSHSIRQNQLNKFNSTVNWITLKRKDQNTLIIDFTLVRNIPVHGLYWHGWGIARSFVLALNIATHGFFWWNVKTDPARWYREVKDLESNASIVLEQKPLRMNWRERHLVLREVDLTLVSVIFSYLGYCHIQNKEKHLDYYAAGVSFLAKTDIHTRFEMNTFEEFFKSLKLGMINHGDWDQKEPFVEAYQKITQWRFSEITDEMKKTFALAFKVEAEHKAPVDLTAVYAMKNYCETYIQALAMKYFKEVKGEEIRIVFEKEVKKRKQ